jgi:hypothetical protein
MEEETRQDEGAQRSTGVIKLARFTRNVINKKTRENKDNEENEGAIKGERISKPKGINQKCIHQLDMCVRHLKPRREEVGRIPHKVM